MKLSRTVKIVLIVVAVEVVALVAGVLLVMLSGFYNVAATSGHIAPIEWVLGGTMDRSVSHHSGSIPVSKTYESPNLKEGYENFDELCVICHGAPGIEQSEIGKGLYPPAPDLAQSVDDWTPSQVFWISKFGVKDTGMPAFGGTRDDGKLWNVAALVKRLPGMTAQQYKDVRNTPAPQQK